MPPSRDTFHDRVVRSDAAPKMYLQEPLENLVQALDQRPMGEHSLRGLGVSLAPTLRSRLNNFEIPHHTNAMAPKRKAENHSLFRELIKRLKTECRREISRKKGSLSEATSSKAPASVFTLPAELRNHPTSTSSPW
ncbi:hypothetical protein M409DRAFT_51930 [Zasmidium cellare ATCC 36951]|uniref:Uncharacterized protein n=1 Tax=Zasmidium cellare ATCC 36951 TaxID=1080233 RepID=A0A6A6CVF1_ZASCE|nr:uncharacterized protein M409DRAFT_51930 [Zasmidium cellare ATCC 36951]KAF2170180.1 hypothetical protein M409DRAFT_51930 [Zasmidium cellare ATCC 36951]